MSNYNPNYDPLVDSNPGQGVNYAPTYWADTAGSPPELDAPISHDMEVDVAIIGSGFTGLSCALFLAEEYGIKAAVLEANQLAWGCTSRNGGQGQLTCGRLNRSDWIKKWGLDTAIDLNKEISYGFNVFKALIKRPEINCEPQGDGHLFLAHRPSMVNQLKKYQETCQTIFNYPTEVLSKDELKERFVNDTEAHGAWFEPEGVSVHPLKLAYGYANIARQNGVTIHPSSPVTSWRTENKKHFLQTPNGIVKATKVAIATGGYTSSQLNKEIAYRYMPILSNSAVTRPLTQAELDGCGLKTFLALTDTRNLRFYYRLLPDNRLQIGTRSAITGKDAHNKKHYDLLIKGLHTKFPILKGIKIDYSWWGWVDVSHDMMPRITETEKNSGIFYSLGYGGNGVSHSAFAGKRMADKIANRSFEHEKLPIYTTPLPKHLFTPFRRVGQRLFYSYYQLKDYLP